jgi:hypothetical protein
MLAWVSLVARHQLAATFNDAHVVIRTPAAWACVIDGREVWIPTDSVLNRDEWQYRLRGRLVISRQAARELGLA